MIVSAIVLASYVLAQDKAKPKQAMYDQSYQPAISYMATGGVGMRYSKHFFDNPFEMQFIDGQTHLDESHQRRLTNIRLQTSNDQTQIDEGANVHSPPVFLSHIYYAPRLDAYDTGSHGVAQAQNGVLPTAGQEGNMCLVPETEEIDLTKEVIRSNRIKMGLGQYGTREEQNVLRSSALMSHAFNWTPSVELPVDKIEQNENEQLIEVFLTKMAKSQNIEIFNHFQALLAKWKNEADRPDYWTSFYTIDLPLHPVTKMGGILEGVQAIDISRLTKSKSPEAYQFLRQQILVYPNQITFNQIPILLPEQRKFEITNVLLNGGDIQIANILTCSPELSVFLPKNQYFPIILSPGQSVTLTVIVAPETWGLMQTAIIVSFSNMFNLMIPVTSYHIANEYELEPIYFTNVNVGEQVQGQIRMKNPSTIDEIEIVELYSTEEYLKLYWPNSVPLASPSEAQSNRDFSKYLKIEPGAKSKQIVTYKFETDQVVDHRAVIHLVTTLGDVIRIPLYFHVYPDLLKFTPSIVDFGLVPYRFDALRVPVSVSIRNGFDVGMLYLSEVLLPVSEKRLDFVMGRWDRDSYGNIQVYNKVSMRLEEQRRGILHRDRTLDLFTVILDPTSYGELDTKILLVFTTEEGKEHRIELPIIGHVMRQNNLLLEDSYGNGSPNFQPQSVAKPAITLNVKPYLNDNLVSSQLLKSKRVEERLIIYNNLGATLKGFEVVEMFPEAVFAYQSGSSSKQTGSSKSAELQVGQSLQLGSWYINTKDLKTTTGRFYFFLQTNKNLFVPMAIQIIDQNLVCSFIPQDMSPTRHQDCQSGVNLDFRKVALNQPVSKYLNVTNIGSEPVSIDWISTTGDNEVFINFLQLDPPALTGSQDFILGEHRGQGLDHQKKRISGILYPRQTITIEIGVEAYIATAQTSTKKATFQFNPPTFGQLKVNLTFTAQPGTAYFSPKKQKLQFQPTFIGAVTFPTEVINFSSKQLGLVCIRQVSVDNPHFKVQVVNSKLKDKSEVLRITFDPNEQRILQSVAVAIKNQSDNSIVLQRVTNQEIPAAHQKTQVTSKSTAITKTEVSKYRQTQQQLHASRKKTDSTVITATLRIETDLMSAVEYKLEAEIVQPTIINENSIDFGSVQVGSFATRSLTLTNPFAEPIQVQLYVGRTTTEIEAELRRLKLLANEKKVNSILDSRNQVQENILQALPFTRFFCARTKLEKQLVLPEYDSIFLQRDSHKTEGCRQILDLMEVYDSVEAFSKDSLLWHQVEEYYRQIILLNANFESNLNFDALSKDQLETMGLISQLEQLVQTLVYTADESLEENQVLPVDQQIVADLSHCTQQKPHLSVNQSDYQELTSQLGFPNGVDYYLPLRPYFKSAIRMATAPVRWFYDSLYDLAERDNWFDWVSYTFQSAANKVSEIMSLFKRKPIQLKPEDFITARLKDKNYQPAATTTNKVQFSDDTIHRELVKNYGVSGADRNVQSFYLNQKFNKPITIAANQTLVLQNAIIYEPLAFLKYNSQFEMLLYVKSDHTPLQSVQLKGKTGSALLTRVALNKVEPKIVHKYAPMDCEKLNYVGLCEGPQAVSDFIAQKMFVFDSSSPQIELNIEIKDALGSVEREQMYRIASSNFLTRIKTFFVQAYSQITQLHPMASGPDLPEEYKWELVFSNVGDQEWRPTKFGFEDQKTGEITCKSGDLELQPCFLESMKTFDVRVMQVILHADYSTAIYRKTLVFETPSHIERYPLVVTTDVRLLDFASKFGKTKAWQSEFLRSISLILISLLLLAYKKVLISRKQQKPQPQITISAPEPQVQIEVVQPQSLIKPDKPEILIEPQQPEVQKNVAPESIVQKTEPISVQVEVVKVKKEKPHAVSRMNKKERKAFEQRRREQEQQENLDQPVENPQEEPQEPQQIPQEEAPQTEEQPAVSISTVQEESVEEVKHDSPLKLHESEELPEEQPVSVEVEPVVEQPPVDVAPIAAAVIEQQVAAPVKPKVQEKVKAPKPVKEPHYRTAERSIDNKVTTEYVSKKQFQQTSSHQSQWRQPVKERPQIVEKKPDPYDYFERKSEQKLRDYTRPIPRNEDHYYYEQEMYNKHVYHRNRDWHYDDEVDYGPEHNEYFDEYHQERYEPKQDLPQYQSMPKRQYWQEPPKQYKPFQKHLKPNYFDRNSFADKPIFSEKPMYGDKPVYFEKPAHSEKAKFAEIPVYSEKPQMSMYTDKPQYGDRVQQYSDIKSMKALSKPIAAPVHNQSLWKPKPRGEGSRFEPEEEEKQRPVSNFYNAFKSIQTMFNQKAVVVQSRTNSQEREEKQRFVEASESELQPRFSLFGDSIWGNDSVQEQEPPIENKLWFKPLRQYDNTMFTDSLESLKKPEPKKEEKYRLF